MERYENQEMEVIGGHHRDWLRQCVFPKVMKRNDTGTVGLESLIDYNS